MPQPQVETKDSRAFRDHMICLYRLRGFTRKAIAEIACTTPETVSRILRKHGRSYRDHGDTWRWYTLNPHLVDIDPDEARDAGAVPFRRGWLSARTCRMPARRLIRSAKRSANYTYH